MSAPRQRMPSPEDQEHRSQPYREFRATAAVGSSCGAAPSSRSASTTGAPSTEKRRSRDCPATVDDDGLSRDVVGGVGSEKHGNSFQLAGCADTGNGGALAQLRLRVIDDP